MQLLNGRLVADQLYGSLATYVTSFQKQTGAAPGLAAVRVGDDPASVVYLQRKRVMSEKLGIVFQEVVLTEGATFGEIRDILAELNQDKRIHGIILQLPLPAHLDASSLLMCIHPLKDVDGLHPVNQGKLLSGEKSGYTPCTPLGCLKLLQNHKINLKGTRCVVVGRSILVGKPLGLLLLNHHATVTFCHSHTPSLEAVTREADILFVAMGKPKAIQAKHVKPGACVVDIGINRQGDQLVGDVCFESVSSIAGALTPVPGGVGPLTVYALMENTLKAAYTLWDLPFSLDSANGF